MRCAGNRSRMRPRGAIARALFATVPQSCQRAPICIDRSRALAHSARGVVRVAIESVGAGGQSRGGLSHRVAPDGVA